MDSLVDDNDDDDDHPYLSGRLKSMKCGAREDSCLLDRMDKLFESDNKESDKDGS